MSTTVEKKEKIPAERVKYYQGKITDRIFRAEKEIAEANKFLQWIDKPERLKIVTEGVKNKTKGEESTNGRNKSGRPTGSQNK